MTTGVAPTSQFKHTFTFSPHHPREFLWEFLPSNIERAQGMPGASGAPAASRAKVESTAS
jgi:hypothetical protein